MVKKKRAPARPRPTARPTSKAASQVTPGAGIDLQPETASPEQPAPPMRDDLTVVGVGASAGGLEAFTQLIEGLPTDAGLALVLLQHMSPKHDSALPALLGAHSKLPVQQVVDGVPLQPNHVYVIPPNMQMHLQGERLRLSPRPDDRTQYTPIDTFFSSMAETAKARGIAVVLSGTAADGAIGIREVKAAGGITFAQQPESARYDGMPRAAIATGMVDLVLTPDEIARELVQIARHPYVRSASRPDELSVRDAQLAKVFELLRPVSGVDFRHYKLPTIRRRLLRRMALHRLTDVDQYVKLLQLNPVEVRGLFQDLLIHVTRFFREPQSFTALTREVYPQLLEGRNPDHPIRAWVCGCATGEEAYALAISLVEFLEQHRSECRVQIFATDVSETAIDYARAGVYPAGIANDVSPERLRRFFTKTDGNYRISKVIRDMCIFARQDLTRDPPFSRLDVVMCRNVLIYLDTAMQKKLIALFHYALNPNGYLVLGQAETVGAQASLFSMLDQKNRVHKKKTGPSALAHGAFPVDYPAMLPRKPATVEVARLEKGLQGEVSRVILDRYAPPAVVVDSDMQIVQFRGQTGAYLEPAPGEASLNLLKMAREGLLDGLRTALHGAKKTRTTVRREGLQVRAGSGWRPVSIEVLPLTAMGRPHFLVLFEDPASAREKRVVPRKSAAKRRTRGKDANVELLQNELAASREYLQSIIQELEAANEELQSANEEILSSNEELQSTNEELDTAKEELQSTNEELNTVNEELHGRNEEMSRINGDLLNLVGSVQIAIVIVSSDLRIRRFTPMAEKVLNLIPADVDRAIGHINPNINCPDLDALIVECMDSVTPIEREVQDRQGHWYLLRIRPYKNLENKIDGAVLALFDIDSLKRSEERLQLAGASVESIIHAMQQPVVLIARDLRVRHANAAFTRLVHRALDQLIGRDLSEVADGWAVDAWRARIAADAVGTLLPTITVGADERRARLAARIVPSPDPAETAMAMITVVD